MARFLRDGTLPPIETSYGALAGLFVLDLGDGSPGSRFWVGMKACRCPNAGCIVRVIRTATRNHPAVMVLHDGPVGTPVYHMAPGADEALVRSVAVPSAEEIRGLYCGC